MLPSTVPVCGKSDTSITEKEEESKILKVESSGEKKSEDLERTQIFSIKHSDHTQSTLTSLTEQTHTHVAVSPYIMNHKLIQLIKNDACNTPQTYYKDEVIGGGAASISGSRCERKQSNCAVQQSSYRVQ